MVAPWELKSEEEERQVMKQLLKNPDRSVEATFALLKRVLNFPASDVFGVFSPALIREAIHSILSDPEADVDQVIRVFGFLSEASKKSKNRKHLTTVIEKLNSGEYVRSEEMLRAQIAKYRNALKSKPDNLKAIRKEAILPFIDLFKFYHPTNLALSKMLNEIPIIETADRKDSRIMAKIVRNVSICEKSIGRMTDLQRTNMR